MLQHPIQPSRPHSAQSSCDTTSYPAQLRTLRLKDAEDRHKKAKRRFAANGGSRSFLAAARSRARCNPGTAPGTKWAVVLRSWRVDALPHISTTRLHACTPALLHSCTPARLHACTPARLDAWTWMPWRTAPPRICMTAWLKLRHVCLPSPTHTRRVCPGPSTCATFPGDPRHARCKRALRKT